MRVTHKATAAVIAVLAGCTWAVPAAVSQAVPTPESAVSAHQKDSVQATSGTTVSFEAPEGWTTTPASSRTFAVYTRSQENQEITLSVVDGSQDFDTTADRVLRQQSLSGTSAAFDGGRISSPNGFSGKTCVAIRQAEKATGPCAVVHKDGTVVTVTATSTGKDEAPDLQAVVDSLEVSKEEAA